MIKLKIIIITSICISLIMSAILYVKFPHSGRITGYVVVIVSDALRSSTESKEINRYVEDKVNGKNSQEKYPCEGPAPDRKAAVKTAGKVWEQKFGKDTMKDETPYYVRLVNNEYWYVTGTKPILSLGGVAEIIIRKQDGQIMYIGHGK